MSAATRSSSEVGFAVSRRWFLRALGLVFLIAFSSLWVQIDGLIGSQGILPLTDYLERAKSQLGDSAYYQLPTLFWFDSSDMAIRSCCLGGIFLSLLLVAGVAPLLVLPGLWVLYLSLSIAGQMFLNFQWDGLLLETCLFAIFVAPATWRISAHDNQSGSRFARWALWWLLFKLMFLSGVTKLVSGDPTWRDLTAMNYHYWTQPLPNPIAWYFHHLPGTWHKAEVVLTFICELGVPLLIFFPRKVRHLAGILLIGLQLALIATGNFGFFNLLTIVLCIALFDDRFFGRIRSGPTPAESAVHHSFRARLARRGCVLLLTLLVFISLLTFVREIVRTAGPDKIPESIIRLQRTIDRNILSRTNPFGSISGYGLFRVMTTRRVEIIIEGTNNGLEWQPYEFRWKPGAPDRTPPFIAPHMPRLDWQMWFAGLNPPAYENMLTRLLQRIQEGQPAVLRLLDGNPFPDQPPRYLRLVFYEYQFTDRRERRSTGDWWKRNRVGETPARSYL